MKTVSAIYLNWDSQRPRLMINCNNCPVCPVGSCNWLARPSNWAHWEHLGPMLSVTMKAATLVRSERLSPYVLFGSFIIVSTNTHTPYFHMPSHLFLQFNLCLNQPVFMHLWCLSLSLPWPFELVMTKQMCSLVSTATGTAE